MAPHIGRVGVPDRHVDGGAGPADLLGGRHDGGRFIHQLAHAVAAGLVPERGVFELAVLAHQGRLAVGDDPVGAAEHVHQPRRHGEPERLERRHQRHQILDIAPGIGVGGDRGDIGLELRRLGGRAELVQHLLDMEDEFPHLHQRPEIARRSCLDNGPRIVHLSLLRVWRARRHRRPRDGVRAIRPSRPRCVQRAAWTGRLARRGRARRPPPPPATRPPRR